MLIEQRLSGAVMILDLDGSLSTAEGQKQLRDTVRRIVLEGWHCVVLNMAKVTQLDSMGLGALVAAYGSIVHSGGRLTLVNLSTHAASALTITRLLNVFDTSDSEEGAVRRLATADGRACR